MGQYHAIACLDTTEALNAHEMGQGIKLLEQGMGGYGGPTTGLALLIAPGGPWHGKRLAVVGDYAEPGDLRADLPFADEPSRLYTAAGDLGCTRATQALVGEAFGVSYEQGDYGIVHGRFDAPRLATLASNIDDDPTFGPLYVVNATKGEYLDPRRFGSGRNLAAIALRNGGVMLATVLLLACSNGRGGGDLLPPKDDPAADLIGSWAGDVVMLGPLEGLDRSDEVAALIERAGEHDERWHPWELGATPDWLHA